MKNFNWTEFSKKVAVKSTMAEMYDAWAVPNKIEKWFLSNTVYRNTEGVELNKNDRFSAGDSYEWYWFLYDGVEKGEITEANGTDFIQFKFANSLVDVQLNEKDEFIFVTLTQKNIPTDDVSKQDIRLGCEKGWTFFLLNLKTVYENGVDQRNQDERLKGTVTS